jgi:hypothetical protein
LPPPPSAGPRPGHRGGIAAVEGHTEQPGADHPPQGAEGLAAGDADLPLVSWGEVLRCHELNVIHYNDNVMLYAVG